MQSSEERARIAAIGRVLAPEVLAGTYEVYRAEQERLAAGQPADAADLAYGDDPRQRLDLYRPQATTSPAPILLWVHGGGFLRGEKSSPDHPYNAHVGRWAARSGMLSAVVNYRLAPAHVWPAGGDDIVSAVAWLRAHAAEWGGDPDRIVLAGTSAGATHVCASLTGGVPSGVRAAILLSGVYGVTPLEGRDVLYYGPQDHYAERRPLDTVIATELPLFVTGAEFDPPRFQAELVGLLAARLERHGRLPRTAIVSGHNHFSLAYHLGTADTRLADELLGFIAEVLALREQQP